ncbi:MAG: prolipoprotein diacylglyceryl transferase [Selenomonadaceae bacterium]|nr:prolipoprotein diacylglyceryl transferase [Selenomonadaceae bacterium]MBQ1915189.1 prolipoprotein diacylglyceryl transferase [Selenomonadaceae bacterium]MBQ3971222.1 prolipoprotein diacylglyceryl transferase [Selenomonadaceae bacterium]
MHQYLFYIGEFPVRTYGLVISLSIILATGVGYFLAKQDGRGYEKHVVDIGIYCGIAGLLGARLWDVFFFDWDYYSHHLTELFNVWQGGMAIQGGVLLGVITGLVYAKRHHLDAWALADILAPAIVLGQALGRCANLLNGDAFGAPTGSAYGILYPDTTLAHHTYGSQPLWPAEVWEGQLDIVIFALLLMFRCTSHAKGQCLALYVMLYSAARFFLEYLRGDYTHLILGVFKSAQMTSVTAFTIAAIAFLLLQLRKSRNNSPPHTVPARDKKNKKGPKCP